MEKSRHAAVFDDGEDWLRWLQGLCLGELFADGGCGAFLAECYLILYRILLLGWLVLSGNDDHLWSIGSAILYLGWLLRDFCGGYSVLNMILLMLRWNINIALLFYYFTYWLCLDFLRIYKGLFGDDFKSDSSEDWIGGQVCQFPFSGVSFSEAEGIEQFLFGWVIPLILQLKIEVFIGSIQFLLLPLSTNVLIHNFTRIAPILYALPQMLVGDWSVPFRIECGGVVGGCAAHSGGVCCGLLEDVGVGVGGVVAGLDLLDVVVMVEFGGGVLAVVAEHFVRYY